MVASRRHHVSSQPDDKNQDSRPMILMSYLTPKLFMTLQVKHRALHLCFSYSGLQKIEYGLIGYEDYLYRISFVGDILE